MARRIAFGQDFRYSRTGEPGRQRHSSAKILLAHLRAGDFTHFGAIGQFRIFFVAIFVFQIHHLSKWHRLDTQFIGMLQNHILGVVGSVEGFAARVGTGTGMIAPHNQVVGARNCGE